MKLFLLFLLPLFSAICLRAGIIVDVVVVTPKEVAQKTLPVTYVLDRKTDRDIEFKVALKEPFGVVGRFDSFELRVLKKPAMAAELKKEYFLSDRIERKERTREKTATFALKAEELANSYLVISSWVGQERGMSKLQSLCLPVAALIVP